MNLLEKGNNNLNNNLEQIETQFEFKISFSLNSSQISEFLFAFFIIRLLNVIFCCYIVTI